MRPLGKSKLSGGVQRVEFLFLAVVAGQLHVFEMIHLSVNGLYLEPGELGGGGT